MAATSRARPEPRGQSARARRIPRRPSAVFCGNVMSAEFTEGAYALRDVLRDVERVIHDNDKYRNNEHRSAALLAERLAAVLARGGEIQSGALAALSHWLVIDMLDGGSDVGSWTPLEAPGFDGGEFDEPHPLSSFFDVAGAPVSLTPDLIALRWVADQTLVYERISVELVRAIGKPISRRRFDALRGALTMS